MVNELSDDQAAERRERPRASAEHAPVLGTSNLNPFGDLVTLQHLCARLAKALRPVFEGMLRQELRCFAEPLVVQRFADYRAERGDTLSAWQPLGMGGSRARAQLVLNAKLVFEMLDSFFGGEGEAPHPLPTEFTPTAEALVRRLGGMIAKPLEAAWEPLTRITFRAATEGNIATVTEIGNDDAVVVTRFGIAQGEHKPVFVDLIYPVAALKPHTASLAVKVHGADIEVEPEWRNALTRSVMSVKLPVRSVLAEPMIPLGRLLDLKEGDVIPIDFGPEVPVMVARRRLGTGLVGTANGRAAVRLTALEELTEEDFR